MIGRNDYRFCAYFHFLRWTVFSFGVSVDWWTPNVEIHLPTGFIRIGWQEKEISGSRWLYTTRKQYERKVDGEAMWR